MWYLGGLLIVEENYALVVNGILWTSLATILVGLRFYTRAFIIRGLGSDDWLMLFALVCASCSLLED
jgi:hypothetical protein